MRFLALIAALTMGAAIVAEIIDPCKRQPFRGRCPSKNGESPKRSQFVLRYYMRNGECVSYPYGHCASDETELQLYRYKEECEDACVNPPPANLGSPKEEIEQTYDSIGPVLNELQTVSVSETISPNTEPTSTQLVTTTSLEALAAEELVTTIIPQTTSEETTVIAPSFAADETKASVVQTAARVSTSGKTSTASSNIPVPVVETTTTVISSSTSDDSITSTSYPSTTTTTPPRKPSTRRTISSLSTAQIIAQTTTVQASTTNSTTSRTRTTAAPRTECERRRANAASSTIRGAFVPVCNVHGAFEKIQCELDGRQCFCVDPRGIEVSNSRTRNGQRPDCDGIQAAVVPKTKECVGSPIRGPCSSSLNRWYYDEQEAKCRRFVYSGCGGNGNNYETENACAQRCAPPPMGLPKCEKGEPLKSKMGITMNCAKSDCPSGYKCSVVQQTSVCCPENNKIIGLQVSNPNDVCSLPKERGPCDKYELRFYFNAESKECKYFFWGGCEGNGNNFEKVEECESTCGIVKVKEGLSTPTASNRPPFRTTQGIRITPGNGARNEGSITLESSTTIAPATIPTVLVSVPSRIIFSDPSFSSGPSTTEKSENATDASVHVAPTRTPPVSQMALLEGSEENQAEGVNRCFHPRDPGNCRGQFIRWYWDNERKLCDVFTYTGCQGNGNNYASREECLAICHKEAAPVVVSDFSNVCKHDVDAGECNGVFQRFAFDTESGECRPFTYGGCGGNGNNFATLAECRIKCQKVALSPGNLCEHDVEVGECSGVFVRFGYDRSSNDCKQFTYGGCGGNGNNFATIQECRNVCVKKVCNPNPLCDLARCQIVNDRSGCPFCSCPPVNQPSPPGSDAPHCPEIDVESCMEPCLVINNRKGCKDCICPSLPTTRRPQPPATEDQRTVAPPRPTAHSITQSSQPSIGSARPPSTPSSVGPPASTTAVHIAPPGTKNTQNPNKQEAVLTVHSSQTKQLEIDSKQLLPPPLSTQLQEKCMQPVEPGPCKHFVDRWFFKAEDGSCHPFKYGGCAGNRNHFFTQNECEIHCARFLHQVTVPSHPLHVHEIEPVITEKLLPSTLTDRHQERQSPLVPHKLPQLLIRAMPLNIPAASSTKPSNTAFERVSSSLTSSRPWKSRTLAAANFSFDLPSSTRDYAVSQLKSNKKSDTATTKYYSETYETWGIDLNRNPQLIEEPKKEKQLGKPQLGIGTSQPLHAYYKGNMKNGTQKDLTDSQKQFNANERQSVKSPTELVLNEESADRQSSVIHHIRTYDHYESTTAAAFTESKAKTHSTTNENRYSSRSDIARTTTNQHSEQTSKSTEMTVTHSTTAQPRYSTTSETSNPIIHQKTDPDGSMLDEVLSKPLKASFSDNYSRPDSAQSLLPLPTTALAPKTERRTNPGHFGEMIKEELAARQYSTGTHSRSYPMDSINSYNPQQNNNLVGLSPPVDPTYFTYSSQHLGRIQSRQFAVSSVPFEKEIPFERSSWIQHNNMAKVRAPSPQVSSFLVPDHQRPQQHAFASLPQVQTVQQSVIGTPITALVEPTQLLRLEQGQHSHQETQNHPHDVSLQFGKRKEAVLSSSTLQTPPLAQQHLQSRFAAPLFKLNIQSNKSTAQSSFQRFSAPTSQKEIVSSVEGESSSLRNSATQIVPNQEKTGKSEQMLSKALQQSAEHRRSTVPGENANNQKRGLSQQLGQIPSSHSLEYPPAVKYGTSEKRVLYVEEKLHSNSEFPRRHIENNDMIVTPQGGTRLVVEEDKLKTKAERVSPRGNVEVKSIRTNSARASALEMESEEFPVGLDRSQFIYYNGDYYAPTIPGVRVSRPDLKPSLKTPSIGDPPGYMFHEFKEHAKEFQNVIPLVNAARSAIEDQRKGANIGSTNTIKTVYLKQQGSLINAPPVRVPDKRPRKLQELSELFTFSDNEYPMFLRAPQPNSTRTQRPQHTLNQANPIHGLPYDNFPNYMQDVNNTFTVSDTNDRRQNDHRPNFLTRLNIKPISTITGIVSDDGEEDKEIDEFEEAPRRASGVTQVRAKEPIGTENYHSTTPPLRRMSTHTHSAHGKRIANVPLIPVEGMVSATSGEAFEKKETLEQRLLEKTSRPQTITGQRVSRTTQSSTQSSVNAPVTTTTTSTTTRTSTGTSTTITITGESSTSSGSEGTTTINLHQSLSIPPATNESYSDTVAGYISKVPIIEGAEGELASGTFTPSAVREDATLSELAIINDSSISEEMSDVTDTVTHATDLASALTTVSLVVTGPSLTTEATEEDLSENASDSTSTFSTSPSVISMSSFATVSTVDLSSILSAPVYSTMSHSTSDENSTTSEEVLVSSTTFPATESASEDSRDLLPATRRTATTSTSAETTTNIATTFVSKKLNNFFKNPSEMVFNKDENGTDRFRNVQLGVPNEKVEYYDPSDLPSPPPQNDRRPEFKATVQTAVDTSTHILKKIDILPKGTSTTVTFVKATVDSTKSTFAPDSTASDENDVRNSEEVEHPVLSWDGTASEGMNGYPVGREPVPLAPTGIGRSIANLDIDELEEPTTIIPLTTYSTRTSTSAQSTTASRATIIAESTTGAITEETKRAREEATTQTSSTTRAVTTTATLETTTPLVIIAQVTPLFPPTTTGAPTALESVVSSSRAECTLPPDAGTCFEYVPRWFFNAQSGQCEQFSYGSCGGNENNFMDRTLCELKCTQVSNAVLSHVPERCTYEKSGGFGKGYNVKWYFNMRNLRCEQFVYEGQGGNENQFETLSDCERTCSPQLPTFHRAIQTASNQTRPPSLANAPPQILRPVPEASDKLSQTVDENEELDYDNEFVSSVVSSAPITASPAVNPSLGNSVENRIGVIPQTAPLPPLPEQIRPPGTKPRPPAVKGAKTVVQEERPAEIVNIDAINQEEKKEVYKADPLKNKPDTITSEVLPIVGASPPMSVNYQTGEVKNKASGIRTFLENAGSLTVEDSDMVEAAKRRDSISCPNGLQEIRYADGRPVMCLPGKNQCPEKSVCFFNGMDFFCCPNEEDPYDKHVFGGYDGEETKHGYKIFGPLNIRRLMDEVPLRVRRQTRLIRLKRQTSMDNVPPLSFNIDSVTAPLRFDDEKPLQVSRAQRLRSKPVPPNHGNPICIEPLATGDCEAAHLRYFYDRNSDTCRLFYYTGCKGNNNNFGSLTDCQRLCILGGQRNRSEGKSPLPTLVLLPGQCPDGKAPLGGSAPVLCGNSTDSIGCPVGFFCLTGPPDICCPGAAKNDEKAPVRFAPELPGVPRAHGRKAHLSTPKFMCPDASDPLMASNGEPTPCGAGFDGMKLCPKGFYCAIDVEKQSRMCCPLFGASERIPSEQVAAPYLGRRSSNPGEVLQRGSLPSDQIEFAARTLNGVSLERVPEEDNENVRSQTRDLEMTTLAVEDESSELGEMSDEEEEDSMAHLMLKAVEQFPGNISEPITEHITALSTEPATTEETSTVNGIAEASLCKMKPSEGRACREDEHPPRTNLHYFYSPKDQRCKLYFYRGCGGNANRFERKADCERLCLH